MQGVDKQAGADVFGAIDGEIGEQLSAERGEVLTSALDPDWHVDADGYCEERYLRAYPDIAEAVASGVWANGREHYVQHGEEEGRLGTLEYLNGALSYDSAVFQAGNIDAAFISSTGWCLVTGWINDERAPLNAVALMEGNRVVGGTRHVARCRREDAEAAIAARYGKLLGFWTIFRAEAGSFSSDPLRLRLFAGSECKTFQINLQSLDDRKLREVALEYLASARYFSNPHIEAMLQLRKGLGDVLVGYNTEISRKILQGSDVEYFGRKTGDWDASIIVCIFGKPEFLFLQAALFSRCPGAERYEFIYVSNSPELAERLMKEATIASRIYDIAITLIILPGNAGFGAANNIAAARARSHRILIVNPDVLPRDRDWARRHSEIVTNLPTDQTAIFGVPLYYEDGSLMHSGMYFEFDTAVSIESDAVETHQVVRVEHYAKGAPPTTQAFLHSRRVPAVTGAFISLDRGWFEDLGGFSLEYIFGHYEDADLCLRSLKRGKSVWIHYAPFWHLEGKGSIRGLAHEGGSTVNRWHFMRTWRSFILDGLYGRSPALFAPTPSLTKKIIADDNPQKA